MVVSNVNPMGGATRWHEAHNATGAAASSLEIRLPMAAPRKLVVKVQVSCGWCGCCRGLSQGLGSGYRCVVIPEASALCLALSHATHPEVRRAGGEDDPVGSDELTVGRECHVHQTLLLEQGVHHGDDGGPVVVPFQAELLARSSPVGSVGHLAQRFLRGRLFTHMDATYQ